MITLLYTLGIHCYSLFIRLAAHWNGKAKLWWTGRQQIWTQISDFHSNTLQKKSIIWVHCASLGEFEQGRPVIESLKLHYPSASLVLTFFSPSGYEIRKQYPDVDLVCYLPIDTPANAGRFVQELRPDLAIFVKYEFWYHHLYNLQKAQVPILLISAIFRPDQLFFKPYGFWYRRLLKFFDHIFVQDKASGDLLRSVNIENFTLTGDTRIDRVLQLQAQAPRFPAVESFIGSAPVWIAGSIWPADEAVLFPFFTGHLPNTWQVILAPHEIGEAHIAQIEAGCDLPTVRYSRLIQAPESGTGARVLIIDNIGMLSALYQYGRIAYIGGGFGKAIHNLLEPIAFSLPVLFGPRHEKFSEAMELKQSGGGFAVGQTSDIVAIFDQLQTEENYQQAAQQAHAYLLRSKGSTEKILNYISSHYTGI